TALMVSARGDPAIADLPEGAATEEAALAMAKALARRAIISWEGIGDAAGNLIKSLGDPGDSRLEALLDILSEQWCEDEKRAFIVVCGDNLTIEMLQSALPRYFPFLVDGISVLRRPSATDVEGVTNL